LPHSEETRPLESGETLILADGRRFRVSSVEDGARGWWFRATALDGSCALQGNLELQWDGSAHVWRPVGTPAEESPDIPTPPSMGNASAPKRKQLNTQRT
jgi:hypothetical protein